MNYASIPMQFMMRNGPQLTDYNFFNRLHLGFFIIWAYKFECQCPDLMFQNNSCQFGFYVPEWAQLAPFQSVEIGSSEWPNLVGYRMLFSCE